MLTIKKTEKSEKKTTKERKNEKRKKTKRRNSMSSISMVSGKLESTQNMVRRRKSIEREIRFNVPCKNQNLATG